MIRSWVLGNEAHENRNGVLLFILLCVSEKYKAYYERMVIFMTDSEKQIEAMGYEICVVDMINNYVVYENKKEDQEITLEWDDEDQYCMLFSQTISREKDWLGHTRQMPQALNICELEIFTARLKELRGAK